KADNIDVLAADAVLGVEGGDRLGMGNCDRPLRLAQNAWPGVALRQMDGLDKRLAQQATLGLGIRPVTGGPEGPYLFAVGLDQSDVDPVERGAAHQTDRRQHHGVRLACRAYPGTPSLCQTDTSYNATTRASAAVCLSVVPQFAANTVKQK